MSEQFENEIERLADLLELNYPDKIMRQIKVLFRDEDESNWNPDNLEYYFKEGPQECPFYSGYFYIPGFSRYVVNTSGDIRNVKSGHTLKWQKTKPVPEKRITGGYSMTNARSDWQRRTYVARHRVLCSVFKHPGKPVAKLWVNHKNGVPGTDGLTNLEWVTPGQNVQHAYDSGLHSNKTVAISTHNWRTDQYSEFPSIQKCADAFGVNWQLVSKRLAIGSRKRHSDGLRFKTRDASWQQLDSFENQTAQTVDVICHNVFTDVTVICGSMSEASRITGTDMGALIALLDPERKTDYPLRGWEFQRLIEFEGWPKWTDKHLQVFKDYPLRPCDGIEVYDKEKNETLFFSGVEKASESLGIDPLVIKNAARRKQGSKSRFIFKLFRLREFITGPLLE